MLKKCSGGVDMVKSFLWYFLVLGILSLAGCKFILFQFEDSITPPAAEVVSPEGV